MAAIVIENITVDFPVYDSHRSIKGLILKRVLQVTGAGGNIRSDNSTGVTTVRALEGITMNVKKGDRLGLIGPNGSGKTTLLRVMAGIYEPTAGSITIDGRISPLFNISLGMDMDDTGYENIFNVGLFLGMTNKDIREKTKEIEEFTELGGFLNLPVRTYSSGMLVRLSFAIATSLHPEILLLDEGLGAGDAKFADKATKRVEELVARASLIVLASHGDALIKQMCNKAALLDKGKLIAFGDTDEVIDIYHQRVNAS
jgi:ABC-type polysaccharide/polyol phosphate transport system ATPase subunit